MKPMIWTLLSFSLLHSAANADILSSTFSNGADGWSAPAADANVVWMSNSGNPGGFLSIEDTRTGQVELSNQSKFSGDLSRFDGGSISFDSLLLAPPEAGGWPIPQFGQVTIESNAGNTTLDLVPDTITESWTTYSMALSADIWGVTQSNWDAILQDVTGISIRVDSYNYLEDTIGFDNFALQSENHIPEPPIYGLFLLGVLGLWVSNRKS